MSTTVVEELAAVLGLNVDQASFEHGNRLLEGLKTGLEALGLAEAAKKFYEFAAGFAEGADEIGKAAQKLGITTNAVQELGYAAQITDVDQDELQQGLIFLAHNLGDLTLHGTGPAADGLHLLGLRADALKGKSLDQTVEILADAFAKMPDGTNKTAAAMSLFSRSGAKLIPLLDRGSAGIAALRKEFVGLGAEIGSDTIKSADELHEQTVRLGAAWQGVKNAVLAPLLPMLTELANGVVEWVKANKEAIASAIQSGLRTVVEIFKAIGDTIAWLAKHKDVVAILLGVATAIFAWMNPIQAVIIALIAIIHYWPQIAEAARTAWDDVVDAIEAAAEAIASPFVDAFDATKSAIEAVIDWIEGKIDHVVSIAKAAVDWVNGVIYGDPNKGRAGAASGTSYARGGGGTAGGAGIYRVPDQRAIAQGYQPTLPSSSMSTTVNVGGITVNGAPGQSEQAIAQQVRTELQQHLNQAHEDLRGGRR